MLCPTGSPDAAVPIAGSRAGALGVVSLEFAADLDAGLAQLQRLCELGRGHCGALVDDADVLEAVLGAALDGLDTVLLANAPADQLAPLVAMVHAAAGCGPTWWRRGSTRRSRPRTAGADAVIAKGQEAGGWIGEEGSFVLSQQLLAQRSARPCSSTGGSGCTRSPPRMSPAPRERCSTRSCCWLASRRLPDEPAGRARGRSTAARRRCSGRELGAPFRAYSRPGLDGLELLREAERELAPEPRAAGRVARGRQGACRRRAVAASGAPARAGRGASRPIWRGASAPSRGSSTACGPRSPARARRSSAATRWRRAPGVAQSHGTRYPLVQGPMTRVSDRAEFAAAVADGGALPFLALALMRGAGGRRAAGAHGASCWASAPGASGVLGFVPAELRAEQLEVVREHRPPFALIAGGRPDQARELEADGHRDLPARPLAASCCGCTWRDGARRFVFEGRECGGHVGPRTSFVLWDTMLRVLLEELPRRRSRTATCCSPAASTTRRSAAMAAATAAAASERGVRVGALMGTAYLFTREATEAGAITPLFQERGARGRATRRCSRAARAMPRAACRRRSSSSSRPSGAGCAARGSTPRSCAAGWSS